MLDPQRGPRRSGSPTSCARGRGSAASSASATIAAAAAGERPRRPARARAARRRSRRVTAGWVAVDAPVLPRRLAARARRRRRRARLRRAARGAGVRARDRRSSRSGTSRSGSPSLFAALACGWMALTWRDARTGLLFAAGPLLRRSARSALIPLAAQLARGRARRAAQAATAVLAAALVAGLRHDDFPFDGSDAAARDRHRGQHAPERGRRRARGVLDGAPGAARRGRRLRRRRGRDPLRPRARARGPPRLRSRVPRRDGPRRPGGRRCCRSSAAAWLTAALLALEPMSSNLKPATPSDDRRPAAN